MTDSPFLYHLMHFWFQTLWSHYPFWFSVKDMTLVHLSWHFFAHLLCLLYFLGSLKGFSDMKQGNTPSFPCDQIIILVPPSDLLSVSHFLSHQWVRIRLSSKSCHCVHKRTLLHAPQHPLLLFHFQPCVWATPSIFPLLKLILITISLSSGRYEALLRVNFTQI